MVRAALSPELGAATPPCQRAMEQHAAATRWGVAFKFLASFRLATSAPTVSSTMAGRDAAALSATPRCRAHPARADLKTSSDAAACLGGPGRRQRCHGAAYPAGASFARLRRTCQAWSTEAMSAAMLPAPMTQWQSVSLVN